MGLQFKPFAACTQLTAIAKGGPTLHRRHHGPGVLLVQGGLIDLGVPLPSSTKKSGKPDGFYGRETEDSVKQFQTTNKLKSDGIVGKLTIVAMDVQLAAKAAPPSLPIPVVPPVISSFEYMVGTGDPPLFRDPGAGPWKSKVPEASYVALKAAILEVLPSSVVLVGDDAVAHMFHYLAGSGSPYRIDLGGMVDEVPSAKARYKQEVHQAQQFVETLPPGAHSITSRRTEGGYNYQSENTNWFFAIGGYVRWGKGQATVSQTGADRTFTLDFEYRFYDRYNWDGGKSVTLFGIKVTDQFMGEFHRQGLAREFDCWGGFRRRFTWKPGQAIQDAQLFSPVGSERG